MILILLLFIADFALGGALYDDVYVRLSEPAGTVCYRILNGTHQFGCHSSKSDGVGLVVKLDSLADISEIKECWRDRFSNYDGGYFMMLDVSFMISTVIEEIRSSSCIKGLILTDRKDLNLRSRNPLSDDQECPNAGSSYYHEKYATNRWNQEGATIPLGLRNIDWNKQIVLITNTSELEKINSCYSMFNVGNKNPPYCALSFSAFSSAAGNSEICRRRSLPNAKLIDLNVDGSSNICDEIAGKNVIAFVPPRPASKNASAKSSVKYLLLAARMDSFGVIPEVSPADFSVMTSLIALIVAARGVGENYESFEESANKTGNHLLFAFFNGESFDYIGSSSMMYRSEKGEFPTFEKEASSLEKIYPDQILAIIEPQHIGAGQDLHLIVDEEDITKRAVKINPILNSLRSGSKAQNRSLIEPTHPGRMPPSSWHSLKKFNRDSVGVVLAPFNTKYHYRRINSLSDHNNWTASDIQHVKKQISQAASAILYAAADHVSLSDTSSLHIDENLISMLLDCLILGDVNIYDCPFIRDMNSSEPNINVKKTVAVKTTYVGASIPHNVLDPNPVRAFAFLSMIYATGTTSHTGNVKDEKTCIDLSKGKVYSYEWQQDPISKLSHCYRHNVVNFLSSSPAFSIEGYDFSNTTFSTWTESLYNYDNGIQLFLIQDKSFEWIMITIGVAFSLLSILIVGRCSEETFIVDEGETSAAMGEPL